MTETQKSEAKVAIASDLDVIALFRVSDEVNYLGCIFGITAR